MFSPLSLHFRRPYEKYQKRAALSLRPLYHKKVSRTQTISEEATYSVRVAVLRRQNVNSPVAVKPQKHRPILRPNSRNSTPSPPISPPLQGQISSRDFTDVPEYVGRMSSHATRHSFPSLSAKSASPSTPQSGSLILAQGGAWRGESGTP